MVQHAGQSNAKMSGIQRGPDNNIRLGGAIMSRARKVPTEVSFYLLEYVLKESGLSREQVAEALEVSNGFIDKMRARERTFSLDQLNAIESLMKMPLGAMLLAAVPIPKPRPETQKLHDLARGGNFAR
jgi:hypothetical protein